jgi:apolipoprotein N-acyltransferase
MDDLLRQLQGPLGIAAVVLVVLAAIVLLALAVKLTKFLLKLLLFLALLALLGGAVWWLCLALSRSDAPHAPRPLPLAPATAEEFCPGPGERRRKVTV